MCVWTHTSPCCWPECTRQFYQYTFQHLSVFMVPSYKDTKLSWAEVLQWAAPFIWNYDRFEFKALICVVVIEAVFVLQGPFRQSCKAAEDAQHAGRGDRLQSNTCWEYLFSQVSLIGLIVSKLLPFSYFVLLYPKAQLYLMSRASLSERALRLKLLMCSCASFTGAAWIEPTLDFEPWLCIDRHNLSWQTPIGSPSLFERRRKL